MNILTIKLLNNMSTLKKVFAVVLLQLIANYGFAQDNDFLKYTGLSVFSKYKVTIEIDKDEYSLAENIHIRFKIDFEEDSLQLPQIEGFKIINTSTSVSTSMRNGATERIKSIYYILKPYKTGVYIIESPTFFVNGEEIKSWKRIIVTNVNLTKKEESELEFKIFAESVFKPDETYRYVIGDKFGYIEISKNSHWKFYRKLTQKELKSIKKIK